MLIIISTLVLHMLAALLIVIEKFNFGCFFAWWVINNRTFFFFFSFSPLFKNTFFFFFFFGQFTEPIGGDITIACESDLVDQIPKTTMERALAEQLKSSKFSKSMDNPKRRGCYYTAIPRFIKHKEIHGQELTSLNLDKVRMIYNLLHNILLLDKHYDYLFLI